MLPYKILTNNSLFLIKNKVYIAKLCCVGGIHAHLQVAPDADSVSLKIRLLLTLWERCSSKCYLTTPPSNEKLLVQQQLFLN